MYPHRIRLRGPWECRPLLSKNERRVPAPRKVTVPCLLSDAGLAGYVGEVRFLRKFGYPGNIDSFERVWLTCQGVHGLADILLNGQLLARKLNGRFEIDVSALLEPHNQLEFMVRADNDQCGIQGDVALEIRCAAYLADVKAYPAESGELIVEGKLFGQCDESLDLYVLFNGQNVSYQQIEAGVLAQSFQSIIPDAGNKPGTVRIDLVCGAVNWHTFELTMPIRST